MHIQHHALDECHYHHKLFTERRQFLGHYVFHWDPNDKIVIIISSLCLCLSFCLSLSLSSATDMVTTCNATHNSSRCSVVLNGTLNLQLMTNASGCELLFKKNLTDGTALIFSLKGNKVTFRGTSEKRSKFFINNGTLRLTNVERTDSGQYLAEIYDSNGLLLGTRRVQLDIEGK